MLRAGNNPSNLFKKAQIYKFILFTGPPSEFQVQNGLAAGHTGDSREQQSWMKTLPPRQPPGTPRLSLDSLLLFPLSVRVVGVSVELDCLGLGASAQPTPWVTTTGSMIGPIQVTIRTLV